MTASTISVSADADEQLGRLLSDAYQQQATVAAIPAELEPGSMADAYLAQQAFLRRSHASIGGWKIGSKSEAGPVQGAPLPLNGIHPASSSLRRSAFPVLGIELEIMFCFDCDFTPRSVPITEAEIMDSVGAMGASIEIVSSRIAGWPEVSKLSQLADLQNHGALIVGELVDYRDGFDFYRPEAHVTFNGEDVFKGQGINPAGDPRRLLSWLVNHCSERGVTIPGGTVITTGSYTGMFFPKTAGMVIGQIAGLPPIHFELN